MLPLVTDNRERPTDLLVHGCEAVAPELDILPEVWAAAHN